MLMLYEYRASSKRKIIKSNYIRGENESLKLSFTMSSNFQRTFAHLVAANYVLNNPPPLQHAPGLHPQLPPPLHPAPASPPAASTPPVPASPTMPVLHAAPPPTSSTDGSIRLTLPLVENRNLSMKGIPTPTTSRGPVATYCSRVNEDRRSYQHADATQDCCRWIP